MDIALALDYLVPAAKYSGSLTANTQAAYDKITWTDSRPKPTWAQLTAVDLSAARPLIERLRTIFETALPQVADIRLKAHFRTIQATVAVCLESNDTASAKYVIQSAKQPDGTSLPTSLQVAQAALLAEFDK